MTPRRTDRCPSFRSGRACGFREERITDGSYCKIAAQLPEYGLDAMLITSAPGERYAVGFEGEGWVLVSREGLITPPTGGTSRRPGSR